MWVLDRSPLYMREIGTMWQIGVLTGALFWVQNGWCSAFWHYKNKERLSRSLEVKWHIPSTCLDASKKWFSTGIWRINRASAWLWLKTQETHQNGQNVHRFQVRTPICHIVPVSRAYLYPLHNVKIQGLPNPGRLKRSSRESRNSSLGRCQNYRDQERESKKSAHKLFKHESSKWVRILES